MISASANNEISRKLPQGFKEVQVASFDDDATHYSDEEWSLATDNFKSDPALDDVAFWTSRVPHRLENVCSCAFL